MKTETEMDFDGARQAFEVLKPHLDAIDEVRRVNVNLQRAVVFAAATGRTVRTPEVRERFATLPESVFDIRHVDDLENVAMAAWHSVVESKRAAVGASQATLDSGLVAAATALKGRMFQVLEYHLGDDSAVRGELDSIREGGGYLDLANDLIRLVRQYEVHAQALAGDTRHYRETDREEASRVAHAIMRELGEACSGDAIVWSDYVSRAWTLLASVYEEVSVAGRFLFRHENPDALFPSLVTVSRARTIRAPGDETAGDDAPVADPEDDGSGEATLAIN